MKATYLGPSDSVSDPSGRVYPQGEAVDVPEDVAEALSIRDDFKVTKRNPEGVPTYTGPESVPAIPEGEGDN